MYEGRNKEKASDNGFIYPIANSVILLLYYLNIVELFKWIAVQLMKLYYSKSIDVIKVNRKIRKARNISVDLFIFLKFLYVLMAWYFKGDSYLLTAVAIYLLWINSFTYFYYHLWEEGNIRGEYATVHRTRRRFINLLQSLLFMLIVYCYLYSIPFNEHFASEEKLSTLQYVLFTTSISFPFEFKVISAISELGQGLVMSQVLLSFLFITILLSQSIPKANKKN
jgi:hypothetical protein